MQPQKRSWIYGGIAHPPSVVVVRQAPRRRLPPSSKLLLAGSDHAWGLAPFIGRLCRDAFVTMVPELDRDLNSIKSWATSRRIGKLVKKERPDMVLISLAPEAKSAGSIVELAKQARQRGATLVWVRPLLKNALLRQQLAAAKIPSFHSEALDIHRGPDGQQPTARGYAGWAGELWRWIG